MSPVLSRIGRGLSVWLELGCLLAVAVPGPGARAEERIHRFDSVIEVAPDGTLTVTETITVKAEGQEIKRGIFRDIPLRAEGADGWAYDVGFQLLSVRQDGASAPHFTRRSGDGIRIYIGAESVFLDPGVYSYEITYEMDRQIRFFDTYDEVYWNVTGNEWIFPIDEAVARMVLPAGAKATDWSGYTGAFGATGTAYTAETDQDGGEVVFATTEPLAAGEGLTVAVAFPKGVANEPSDEEKFDLWFNDHMEELIAGAGISILFVYYMVTWWLIGRGPSQGVVFPRFEPPQGISPALANYIVNRGFGASGWTALAAACLNLAVKGRLVLEKKGSAMVLQPRAKARGRAADLNLPKGEAAVEAWLAMRGSALTLNKKNGKSIATLGEAFMGAIEAESRTVYFKTNGLYVLFGFVMSALVVGTVCFLGSFRDDEVEYYLLFLFFSVFSTVIAFGLSLAVSVIADKLPGELLGAVVYWVGFGAMVFGGLSAAAWLAAEVTGAGQGLPMLPLMALALVGMFLWFAIYIDAPTVTGRKVLDEIEGLKLYLTVAEEDRMNMGNAPMMSPGRFETLLPYAVALGVEKPWADAFQSWLSSATASAGNTDYQPNWYRGGDFNSSDIGRSVAMTAGAMAGSFSSSLPVQSSSSSGSSGGGSSGGGGGGGGGGGW